MRVYATRRPGRKDPNTWLVTVELAPQEGKKRPRRHYTFHGGKRALDAFVQAKIAELEKGLIRPAAEQTVADFLDEWLANDARPNLAPKTVEGYQGIVEQHLKPSLGKLRLDKLKGWHIQQHYTAGQQDGYQGGPGLSRTTVLQHHRVIHKALAMAVKWEKLTHNPADNVAPPRPERTEVLPPSVEDVNVVLAETRQRGSRYCLPLLLALTTGMRRGEICALRWDDIDLAGRRLIVRRSLEQTREGLRFKEPKSRRGLRAVALPAVTVAALAEERRVLEGHRQHFLGFNPENLVLYDFRGGPVKPDGLGASLHVYLRNHHLPDINFHALRHLWATFYAEWGYSPLAIAQGLGHASPGFTLGVYGHILPGVTATAPPQLDDAFGRVLDVVPKRLTSRQQSANSGLLAPGERVTANKKRPAKPPNMRGVDRKDQRGL